MDQQMWRGEVQSDIKSLLAHKDKIDATLERMDEKNEEAQDKILNMIGEINITLARNTVSLEHHIARTDALESRVEQVHGLTVQAKGIWWFLGALGALAVGIKELFF